SGEPADYNFDRIREWCAAPKATGVDCSAFLNAWNFFDDLLVELSDGDQASHARLSPDAAAYYDKLFWGSNLPAVTPPGEWCQPRWQAAELTEIRLILEAGLEHFESELWAAGVRV